MNRRNFLTRVFASAVATPALLRIIEASEPKPMAFSVVPPIDPPNRAPIYWHHGRAQNLSFREAVQILDNCEMHKRANRPHPRVRRDDGTC